MTVQPFSDPISGGGILVQPEIRSPNFVTGVSGWIVRADGSAEFNDLFLHGGTVTITSGLLQFLFPLSNGITFIAPSGDTTGATDFGNVAIALSVPGANVVLMGGTFWFSAPVGWTDGILSGSGDFATTIVPGTLWPGSGALLEPGSNVTIENLRGYGGSGTRSANPVADFIAPQAGADWITVSNIRCDFMNGSVFNGAPSQGIHWDLTGIRGEHDGGGIRIDNGTGSSVTAEVNIVRCNIQNCETGEVLFLSSVTDVLVSVLNGSIKAGAAVNGITVQGACQTIQLLALDVGGGAGTGMLVLKAAGTSSPSDVIVTGKLQSGQAGVVVNDSCARIQLTNVQATRNKGDGFQWNGTGAFNTMTACEGNNNNQAAGTAYDVNVTSTAHICNTAFAYVSGGVTAGRNLTSATNHYTEVSPPSSLTTAGNAPGGW